MTYEYRQPLDNEIKPLTAKNKARRMDATVTIKLASYLEYSYINNVYSIQMWSFRRATT
jgi:hypothetical protein